MYWDGLIALMQTFKMLILSETVGFPQLSVCTEQAEVSKRYA